MGLDHSEPLSPSSKWWLHRLPTPFGNVLIACKLLLSFFSFFCLSGGPVTFGVMAGEAGVGRKGDGLSSALADTHSVLGRG